MLTNDQIVNIRMWRDELRITQELQGQGEMGNSDIGKCCIAILCDRFHVPYKSSDTISKSTDVYDLIGAELSLYKGYVRLPDPDEMFFTTDDDAHLDNIEKFRYSIVDFTALNDDLHMSFNEIADYIDMYLLYYGIDPSPDYVEA